MMDYIELDKKEVIEAIGFDEKVIMCDFETNRMLDCKDLTINAIISFTEKAETKFFKGVENE